MGPIRKLFNMLLDGLGDLLFGGLGDDAKWRAVLDHVGLTNLYLLLFAIVFCETGLVVTPFLPGDSLLFALGAVGARDVGINLPVVTVLMIVAAVLGDAANYWIGHKLGPAVFRRDAPDSVAGGKPRLRDRLLNRKHLAEAQHFYERYGGKTIILARFIPVVRTFAPFVAGVGRMSYPRFLAYNVVGAVAWVCVCVGAGVAFGQREFVKKNFELVIVAIVVISVLPMVVEIGRAWWGANRGRAAVVEAVPVERAEPEKAAEPTKPA